MSPIDGTEKSGTMAAQPDIDHDENALDVKNIEQLRHTINQPHSEIYAEALARYPNDESIDQAAEKKLKRKLDRRILPLLGMCYFFYVRIRDDPLHTRGHN